MAETYLTDGDLEKHRKTSSKRSDPATRRQIILEALLPDANLSKIARDYDINRSTLYELIEHAVTNPKAKMLEAEAEAEFRRRVWELVR